jgi:hypothetical protein
MLARPPSPTFNVDPADDPASHSPGLRVVGYGWTAPSAPRPDPSRVAYVLQP